jgi:hypothetical protein
MGCTSFSQRYSIEDGGPTVRVVLPDRTLWLDQQPGRLASNISRFALDKFRMATVRMREVPAPFLS